MVSSEKISDGILKLGPDDVLLGRKWSHQDLTDIKEISISYEPGWIHNISMVYDGHDEDDIIKEVGEVIPWVNHAHMVFAPGEFLTRIYGYNQLNKRNYPIRILSLGIETNNHSYGPFGDGFSEPPTTVEPFSFDIGHKRFRGFYGSVSGDTVSAIGVYVKKYISNSKNIGKELDWPVMRRNTRKTTREAERRTRSVSPTPTPTKEAPQM